MRAWRPSGTIVGFHLDDPVAGLPVLSHCGDEVCAPRHTIAWHQHDRFEFCYVAQGRALWRLGEGPVAQETGQMFIALPGQRHQLADRPHESYHILYAGVDLERLGPRGRELARLLVRRRCNLLPRAQEAEAILRGVVRQAMTPQPLQAQVVKGLLQTLVLLTAQRLAGMEGGLDQPAHGPHSYPVQAALACLRAQAHQRIPTAELARVVNYSPGHFLRLFKKEVGITPADFHLRWRLEAARDELHQPGRSVTEVALRFGFSSSQHFSRAFHQAFGATPRQDRGRAQDRG